MDTIKWLLELCDNNEKNIFKAAIVVFFPLYLTSYLFFPTFRTLDFWTCLFLIAGVDILLNFMLLFLVQSLAKNNNKLQCNIMIYVSLLTIVISITTGIFLFFQTIILYTFTTVAAMCLLLIAALISCKDKEEKAKEFPKD